MERRRKHSRVDISFPVECHSLRERSYFYTVSKNLSLGGARIIIDDFIQRGNLLKLHINLVDKIISLKAKVIWCNKARISDRYHVGLSFVEINEINFKKLSRFLNKVHPDRYEKN